MPSLSSSGHGASVIRPGCSASCATSTAGQGRPYGWTAATGSARDPGADPARRGGLGGRAIAASGGLDEYAVDELVRSGAPIDFYAVGARVGVSAHALFLDSAYKLHEYEGLPVMKLSSGKVTAPGQKQVFRRPGRPDVIALRDERPPQAGVPLLETVMRAGRRTAQRPALATSAERLLVDLARLSPEARRIRGPPRRRRWPPSSWPLLPKRSATE
ncbi:hypothetical protein [Streptomyces sp. AK04-3B]|uniref:hypothetical protein n=1 Tax=Streptomyces sp. AK04-3B TaxID=3028650 RepID=UPI0039F4A66C